MSIDTLLAILNIEKGKVPGIDKDAPANKSYYLSCEHFDEETERASWHKTNADEVVKEFKQALNLYIEERERLARIDEHNKLDKFLDNQIAVGAVRAWSMERKQTIKSELEG